MSMFLTIQARSQPDVCTQHKQCLSSEQYFCKNLLFLIRKISSILEQLYMYLHKKTISFELALKIFLKLLLWPNGWMD